MNLGDRIRRLRRKNGFTLKQLSGRSGYCKSYLGQIENSYYINPSAKLIYKLASIFGVTTEYILYGEISDQDSFILSMIKNLSDSDKYKLISIIDTINHEKQKIRSE